MLQRSLILIGFVALAGCAATPVDDHSADIHSEHAHVHGENCGHTKVWHVDHWDYLHDGHLHFVHDGHVDEHVLEVSETNPTAEAVLAHDGHMHGSDDVHMMVPHGDHFDYLHDGHLHYVHGDHVDDHGSVTVEENS
jgi:hypothetical protein